MAMAAPTTASATALPAQRRSAGSSTAWTTSRPQRQRHLAHPGVRLLRRPGRDDRLDATGYFACDFFNVDPNFGSNAQLKTLVDAAHQRGLHVFLDGVFGHVNKVGVSKPSPEGRLPALKSGGAGYPGQLVDYSQPESLAYFKEVARHWIEQYGIDGWRPDQAYQLGLDDWRAIRTEVEQASAARKAAGLQWGTLGYMVGEVWKGPTTSATRPMARATTRRSPRRSTSRCATAWCRRWRWRSPARAGRGPACSMPAGTGWRTTRTTPCRT